MTRWEQQRGVNGNAVGQREGTGWMLARETEESSAVARKRGTSWMLARETKQSSAVARKRGTGQRGGTGWMYLCW